MTEPMIHVSTAENGEAYAALGGLCCKLSSAQTGGACTVLELRLAPGQGAGLHQHTFEDETLTVLVGECTVESREHTWRISAGGCAFFPRGAAHAFRNDGALECVLLITAIPGGLDHYFSALDAAVAAQDAAAVAAANAHFGITLLGGEKDKAD